MCTMGMGTWRKSMKMPWRIDCGQIGHNIQQQAPLSVYDEDECVRFDVYAVPPPRACNATTTLAVPEPHNRTL